MHKPFHMWIDLFKRLGLRPAGSPYTPPPEASQASGPEARAT